MTGHQWTLILLSLVVAVALDIAVEVAVDLWNTRRKRRLPPPINYYRKDL
jgi:hypothetical protein